MKQMLFIMSSFCYKNNIWYNQAMKEEKSSHLCVELRILGWSPNLFSQALNWINDCIFYVTYIMEMVIFFRAKCERIINKLIFFNIRYIINILPSFLGVNQIFNILTLCLLFEIRPHRCKCCWSGFTEAWVNIESVYYSYKTLLYE